jgi:hypothetical protein
MDSRGESDSPVDPEKLRDRVRADMRLSSVPLLVFGVLTILSIPLANDPLWTFLFWPTAGPIGFIIIAVWYRMRRIRTGLGPGRGPYARIGAVLFAAFLLILPLIMVQLPAIGIALLVIAVLQGNRYLAICAIVFGVVGGLEIFGAFDDWLYQLGQPLGLFARGIDDASAIIFATLGAFLMVAGLIALKRERRSANG